MKFSGGSLCLFLALSVALPLQLHGCAYSAQTDRMEPAAHWASPQRVEGLPNLHKVSDELYRSAQPTEAGMRAAEKLPIRSVLSLRSGTGDAELAQQTGLTLVHVPMRAWNPNLKVAVAALRALKSAPKPVLVHCYHGADRTGMVVALYRMTEQNWSREEAVREMLEGGYGYHSLWTGIIDFLQKVDIAALRTAVQADATR